MKDVLAIVVGDGAASGVDVIVSVTTVVVAVVIVTGVLFCKNCRKTRAAAVRLV